MKWIVQDGYVVDIQDGSMICLMAKTPDPLRDKMVELAPEMFNAIVSFVEQIEGGKFAAKSTYNDLKRILERVPENMLEDAKMQVQ